jgi:outer membrane receptor protein involved in Fe transport
MPILRHVSLSLFFVALATRTGFSVPDTGSQPLVLDPITITAAPEAKSTLNTPASVTVLEGRQLDRAQGQSVMSAIQDTPGVNMISEGPTVVKPVIRGLNSQDIVVVEDGVRSENLQWGNEHAPEIDPLGTDRIEVMRGPNSLLYGSDALGGVIAINHPDLPNAHLGDKALAARLSAMANSNNNSVGENLEASGATGDWGYRANFSQLQGGNFRTPESGYVPNTGINQVSGNGALGVRKEWGSLDLDVGKFNKRIELQNPGAPFPTAFDDLEYQTLQHDHGKIHSLIDSTVAHWELTLGYDRSNRKEFGNSVTPQDAPVLNWIEASYTADAKAHLAALGPFKGTLGVSGLRRVEEALGQTHLTPGYNENGAGEYLVEDLPVGAFDFTAGIRGDQNQYHINADDLVGSGVLDVNGNPHPAVQAQTLSYSAVSAAVGGVYHVTEPLALAVNVGRGYRNPIAFELFGYGEHEGAGIFQEGNPNLSPETSLNTDVSIRWSSQRVKAELGVFRNYIHNFIYGTYNGQFLDATSNQIVADSGSCPDGHDCSLPVVSETQANATIQGVDGALGVAATEWLTLKTVYNLVRGYNDSGDPSLSSDYLPHVPADNVLVGADIHGKSIGVIANPYFGIDEKFTAAHQRTAPEEIPTPGYALTDLHAGGEVVVLNNRLTLDVGVNNLFDRGYIDFNSILKEFNIENPGRNVYVKVSLPFGS